MLIYTDIAAEKTEEKTSKQYMSVHEESQHYNERQSQV